jgi:hypothetical protein
MHLLDSIVRSSLLIQRVGFSLAGAGYDHQLVSWKLAGVERERLF